MKQAKESALTTSKKSPQSTPCSGKVAWVLIAILGLLLIPLFILGLSDRPSADDYSYALYTRDVVQNDGGNFFLLIKAALDTSAEFMQNWQGLYSSAFLLALQPGIFGNAWYAVTPIILFAIIAFSILLFFRTVERDLLRIRSGSWPLIGMIITFFVLQCMPSLTEGFYWYNGAMNYTPFFCLTLINCVCAIKFLFSSKQHLRILLLILSCVLSLVISGGNHVTAVLNALLMLGFLFFALRKRRTLFALTPFAAIVGLLINVTSPGTVIRRSFFPDSPSLFSTLYHSFIHTFDAFHQWADLSFFILLIIVTPCFFCLIAKTEIQFSVRKLFLFSVLSFFLIVGLFCIPFYAMGSFGEGRVENVIYLSFLFVVTLLYGYGLGCFYRHLQKKLSDAQIEQIFTPLKTKSFVVLFLIGICGILLLGNLDNGRGTSLIAIQELKNGNAQTYAAQMDEREQLYLSSSGEDVVVEKLKVQPDLLFFKDLESGDETWSASVKEYYQLKSLNLEES